MHYELMEAAFGSTSTHVVDLAGPGRPRQLPNERIPSTSSLTIWELALYSP